MASTAQGVNVKRIEMVVATACIALLVMAGCNPRPAYTVDQPASEQLPDVIGVPEAEAVEILKKAMHGDADRVVVLSTSRHGPLKVPSAEKTAETEVTTMSPAPGRKTKRSVWVRIGPVPEGGVRGVETGVGWFDHAPLASTVGEGPCRECHTRDYCADCHEQLQISGRPHQGEISADLDELGRERFGRGSDKKPGLRRIVYRGDGFYSAEVTVDSGWTPEQAAVDVRIRTLAFVNDAFRTSSPDQLARLEVAWFKAKSKRVALWEIYDNAQGWQPFMAQDLYRERDFTAVCER